MKSLFSLLLLSLCFSAQAQRSSDKHVTTDGRSMHIRIDMEQAGRSLHYNRSFNIEDMGAGEVKALENHVVDSLNQVMAGQTNAVAIDQKSMERNRRYERRSNATYSTTYTGRQDYSIQASSSSALLPSEVTPTSVLVREDKENGRLWMQYTFEKDGEELIIERTANVVGKSEREKQAIIKETERNFGIKLGNQ